LEGVSLNELLVAGVAMRALENSVLFDAGDPSSCAYLVVDGLVRVERLLESGERLTLGRLGRGHVVGDMGLLSGEARSATAISEDDTLALRLDRGNYLRLRDQGHPAAIWLLEEVHLRMGERVESSYERIVRMHQEPELARELPSDPVVQEGFLRRLWTRVRS
jgi:CRP-like cAMP-binding protein